MSSELYIGFEELYYDEEGMNEDDTREAIINYVITNYHEHMKFFNFRREGKGFFVYNISV